MKKPLFTKEDLKEIAGVLVLFASLFGMNIVGALFY